VEAVGPGVQDPIVGTRVVFIGIWNTWREQIVCPVDRRVPFQMAWTIRPPRLPASIL